MSTMDDGKRYSGAMSLEERLQRMDGRFDSLEDKIDNLLLAQPKLALELAQSHAESSQNSAMHHAENDTKIARMKDKLELHDRIMMATCGVVGLGVIVAVLKLVVRDS